MRYIIHILKSLIITLPLVIACGKIDSQTESSTSGPFLFSVSLDGPMHTKAEMINSQDALRLACTPTDEYYPSGSTDPNNKGKGNAIGIWADKKMPTTTPPYYTYVKNEFDGVHLKWTARGDGGGHESTTTHDPNKFYWNTFSSEGQPGNVYWHEGETYYFRAYYPASMYASVLPNTNAQAFITSYRAESLQEDLMVAYTIVGPITGSAVDNHVQLTLKHALSALKFKFQFNSVLVSAEDYLTAMWLENGASGSFYNYGTLVYGNGESYEGSGYNNITWTPAYTPGPGIKMYNWSKKPDGIQFTTSTAATAYGKGTYPGDEGEIFTDCNNWIYVVPQALNDDCWICFQTKIGGDAVFRTKMPTSFTSQGTTYTQFEPGYRYEFLLLITELNVDVRITIQPWNIYNSSYSIDF